MHRAPHDAVEERGEGPPCTEPNGLKRYSAAGMRMLAVPLSTATNLIPSSWIAGGGGMSPAMSARRKSMPAGPFPAAAATERGSAHSTVLRLSGECTVGGALSAIIGPHGVTGRPARRGDGFRCRCVRSSSGVQRGADTTSAVDAESDQTASDAVAKHRMRELGRWDRLLAPMGSPCAMASPTTCTMSKSDQKLFVTIRSRAGRSQMKHCVQHLFQVAKSF